MDMYQVCCIKYATVAILLLLSFVIILLSQFIKLIGLSSVGDSPVCPGFNITEITV